MARVSPQEVDVLIVGNGPSSLIASYILHGNIPILDSPHPDPILHDKIKNEADLLDLDIDHVTEHFLASTRFPYSTQALPVNVLLDTLLRPYGETDDKISCVRWISDPSRAISHIAIGSTNQAGGQWCSNPVSASVDIGTLSYLNMLSLPGYGFEKFYQDSYGKPPPAYLRPPRRDVARYFAAYPHKVGISEAIYNGTELSGIRRTPTGFYVASHDIHCKHLVLASGIFSKLIPKRPLLQPLCALPSITPTIPQQHPLLVVGSGFSAADVIISAPKDQKLIHIFKWDPANHPSPLRACHQQAYPEYAGVYKRMKLAALAASGSRDKRPKPHRGRSSNFDQARNWDAVYEGLPNTEIVGVRMDGDSAEISLSNHADAVFHRQISAFSYVVGRRGALDYLSPELQTELGLSGGDARLVSGQTLRERANEDLELARDVFIVGSLTGDSLIRFAYGSCAYAAGTIMRRRAEARREGVGDVHQAWNGEEGADGEKTPKRSSKGSPVLRAMNGLDGHNGVSAIEREERGGKPLDRRKDSL